MSLGLYILILLSCVGDGTLNVFGIPSNLVVFGFAKFCQVARPQKQDPYRSSSQKDAYIKKPRPAGQSSVQRPGASSKEQYNKKRRAEDAFSDEEGFDFRSEIRKMFG